MIYEDSLNDRKNPPIALIGFIAILLPFYLLVKLFKK